MNDVTKFQKRQEAPGSRAQVKGLTLKRGESQENSHRFPGRLLHGRLSSLYG